MKIMSDSKSKILVLGLDGATWKVLDPLMKAGFLPTFQKLVIRGASGTLVSTIPPITSPAWPSMATGLNPGKLGVYSTLKRNNTNMFSLKPVTSDVYKGKAVWDLLSNNKIHVALFKIPFLYPVYETNGCMVSGFGSASKFAAYPRNLHKKLTRGPSSLLEAELFKSLSTLDLNDEEACVKYIERLKMIVQKEGEVILRLVSSMPWDFLFYVVSSTDWLQHAFMDRIVRLVTKISCNNSLELEITDKAVIDFYKSVDFLIGRFLNLAEQTSDNFIFLIVSDHGFTVRPYTFNLAKWLIRNGYTKLRTLKKKYQQSISSTLVDHIADLSKGTISGKILEKILKNLPSKTLQKLKSEYFNVTSKPGISNQIDFDSSRVFCLEDRGIYLNRSATDAKTLDEMISDLNRYLSHFPHVILKTFRRNEIYWGSKVQLAPDLIIKILDKDKIWEVSTDPTKPLIFKPQLPGIHDNYGIFVAYGSKIRQNVALGKTLIWNVCPTILHFFGQPIPSNIDGEVLKQIFTKEMSEQKTTQRISERERIERRVQRLKEKQLVWQHPHEHQ